MKNRIVYFFISIIVFFLITNPMTAEAKVPTNGSMSCEYVLDYTGYDLNEQKIKLIVSVENGKFNNGKFEEIKVSGLSPLDFTQGQTYNNNLKADHFVTSDEKTWKCNTISYSIDKAKNGKSWQIKIDSKEADLRNIVSSSKSDYVQPNDEIIEETPDDEVNSSPSPTPPTNVEPSPSTTEEKLTFNDLGEKIDNPSCSNTMGDLLDELQKYYNWIKIMAPILLIIFGVVDLAGAVINVEKDQLTKSLMKFIRRAVAAIVIFFLPIVIELLLTLPGMPTITDVICGIK